MVAYAHGQPVSSADIRVDGDTIALSGLRQHLRLVGFNAPETDNARCDAEAQLGQRAKQRLPVLVDTGSLELTFIACSCPPGTGSNAALHSPGAAVEFSEPKAATFGALWCWNGYHRNDVHPIVCIKGRVPIGENQRSC